MNRLRHSFRRIVAVAGILALAPLASAIADPVTVAFRGRIMYVDYDWMAGSSIPLFSSFSGFYTIDPDLVSPGPFIPLFHAQPYIVDPGGGIIQATVNGMPFSHALRQIDIFNDMLVGCEDASPCDFWTTDLSAPIGSIIPRVFFESGGGTRLNSFEFFVNEELTGWTTSDFMFALWEIGDDGGGGESPIWRASGRIESLQTVPEPELGLVLAVGSAALGAASREKRGRLRPKRMRSRTRREQEA